MKFRPAGALPGFNEAPALSPGKTLVERVRMTRRYRRQPGPGVVTGEDERLPAKGGSNAPTKDQLQ